MPAAWAFFVRATALHPESAPAWVEALPNEAAEQPRPAIDLEWLGSLGEAQEAAIAELIEKMNEQQPAMNPVKKHAWDAYITAMVAIDPATAREACLRVRGLPVPRRILRRHCS
jgi:hypothetical protein